MVYDIDYIANDGNRYTLFDIEIWLKPRECVYEHGQYHKDDNWHSELKCSNNGRGIAKFVFEQIHDEEKLNKFMKDCDKINWLRGYLHEEHSNYWLTMDQAGYALYHNHLPDIKKVIFDFANKWNLSINED